jgi:N-methylhydantoinase A/oxoprolinase/acetone carboxylase beta subunit
MNAKEYLHKKDVAYMNRLSTELDFEKISSLMEDYAALRIHDVVGRSGQLSKLDLDEVYENAERMYRDEFKEWIQGKFA